MNAFAVSFLAISFDYGSTKYAISQGAYEANPLMRSHLEIKKSVEVVLIGSGIKLIEKRNKKAGKITKIALIVSHAIIAGHNIKKGREAK